MELSKLFDARGLKCPLAFVKAKQALLHHQVNAFLFDEKVSCDNFIAFLDKKNINCEYKKIENYIKVIVL